MVPPETPAARYRPAERPIDGPPAPGKVAARPGWSPAIPDPPRQQCRHGRLPAQPCRHLAESYLFCLTPVFVEAQEQFHRTALRVVHFVHHAGHPPHNPRNRGHCNAPLFAPAVSPAGSSSIAVRPPAPNRTNALIPAPAPALGRVAPG